MQKQQLKVGQLVQLNPETVRNVMFTGCILVVTEPKVWGGARVCARLGTE